MLELARRRSYFAAYRGRFACPCCGYPTLRRRGIDEICYLCWWEDDGQDDADAGEVRGGPNAAFSLTHARRNFEWHGVMYEPWNDRRISGPDTPDEAATKKSVIAAFQKMSELQPSEHEPLWQVACAGEQQLRHRLGSQRSPKPSSLPRRIGSFLLIYLAIVGLALLSSLPWFPRTPLGWILFAVFAPPVYVASEWLGDRISGPWWESSMLGKAFKALTIILGALLLMIAALFISG